jgi:hypothetical protein
MLLSFNLFLDLVSGNHNCRLGMSHDLVCSDKQVTVSF